MGGGLIYLDHNATTPVLPEVVDAMLPYLREQFGNPSSTHAWGRRARAAVDAARDQIARLLACAADEIVFTSGGTEANNLAIFGASEAQARGRHCVTSTIEHPATTKPCRALEARGWHVDWIPVDGDAVVRLDALEASLRDDTALVTVMHANNETGTVQPVRELARMAHRRGALVHTDAAQTVGKIAVDVNALHVDLLSIAGHKLYAPKGVGALYVRRGTPLAPMVMGAAHESGRRPGTENVASIVGLGVACELAQHALSARETHARALRDRLWSALAAGVHGLALNGHATDRLPNTVSVRFPGVLGSAVLDGAPDVAASTGSACHEGAESASAVLLAMGIDATSALGTVRLSVGATTTDRDVDDAAALLIASWMKASNRDTG